MVLILSQSSSVTVIVLCPIKHATILTPIRRCNALILILNGFIGNQIRRYKSVFLTPYIDKLNLSDKEKEF